MIRRYKCTNPFYCIHKTEDSKCRLKEESRGRYSVFCFWLEQARD